jgi:hypothetical protein
MKRASLKTAKVPLASSSNKDVTDRILKDAEPASPAVKPAPKTIRRQKKTYPASSTADEPLPYIPYRTVPESARTTPPGPQPHPPKLAALTKTDRVVANALSQVQTAIATLQDASRSAPAQYDLALRYRLDALAHHLEQVAEFVARELAQQHL